jgi:hypothetical protein
MEVSVPSFGEAEELSTASQKQKAIVIATSHWLATKACV